MLIKLYQLDLALNDVVKTTQEVKRYKKGRQMKLFQHFECIDTLLKGKCQATTLMPRVLITFLFMETRSKR